MGSPDAASGRNFALTLHPEFELIGSIAVWTTA